MLVYLPPGDAIGSKSYASLCLSHDHSITFIYTIADSAFIVNIISGCLTTDVWLFIHLPQVNHDVLFTYDFSFGTHAQNLFIEATVKDAYVKNGITAERARRREQHVIVFFAVRHRIALEEITSSERLLAMCADEMLRVPQLTECCDHLWQVIWR